MLFFLERKGVSGLQPSRAGHTVTMTRHVLLLLPGLLAGIQSSLSIPVTWQAVESTPVVPAVSEISFATFDFQDATFLHAGPGLFDIDGEPVKGARYPVESYLYGTEAIATARFEIVDSGGMLIEPIAMARLGTPDHSRFVGLVVVPQQPFRVALSGVGVDGQPFRRVHRRLFRPVDRGLEEQPRRLDANSEEARLVQLAIESSRSELIAEVEAAVAGNPGGQIVMPRMEVSNVRNSPLLSAQGRVIGVRVGYEVKFSARAAFNPIVGVAAEYRDREWRGLTRMVVFNGSITPLPRHRYPPYDEFAPSELRPTPLEYGAEYLYEANTVYQFTADLVPGFVVHNIEKTKACINSVELRSPYRFRQEAIQRMLADEALVPYTVAIGPFKGRIAAFYPYSTFHRSFVTEGARDCGPTRRF